MKSPPIFRVGLWAFLAGLALTSASAQDVAADTVPNVPTPAGVRIYADLAYVERAGDRQKLDLYLPFPIPGKPVPVIVYLHGGGWQKGSKADGRRLAFRMVAQGYAVACVNYRLTGDAPFPAQVEDCKTAVRWLRANATRYRLDPGRVGVIGVASGGYLATFLGLSASTRLFDSGANLGHSSGAQAVCVFFAPVDLLQLFETADESHSPLADEIAKLLGGNPRTLTAQARAANPLTYLYGDSPPFLIIHGTADTVVPPAQSQLLFEALAKRRIPVHRHLIREAGHIGPAFVAPEIDAMVDDFFANMGKGRSVTAVQTESTARKD